MSGIFLARVGHASATTLDAAQKQFVAQGCGKARPIATPGWHGFHWPAIFGGPETFLGSGDDFIAVAGTLVHDGEIGTAALRKFLDKADLPHLDWSRIGGEFTAVVRKRGRCFVFCDYFAAYQMFHDLDARFFSTSFLAAAGAMPRLRFDAQGVYEYAINAAPIGDDTVFDGLKTLGPDRMIELLADGVRVHAVRKPLPDHVSDMSVAERLARHRDRLLATIAPFARQFGDRVHCPLSGGLDSRLVLAALRAVGSTPNVYVYGPAGDGDVAIAQQIGINQGFEVRWIDKAASRSIAPDAFAEQVRHNFQQWDALPNYGNIFDNGGNLLARDARHADGALAISGGCGEIFRNFFYLPDRPLSANNVARTFFARTSRRDFTDAFDHGAFVRCIGKKIAAAVDVADPDRPMPRTMIEQLYPRVRCRALFGREISLESRLGAYAMPFLDHRMVGEALTLPMALKTAGRFEAMLIDTIDPALAAEPSAYGHDFASPPSYRHRFDEWSSRSRPIWLRERSYAIQRRLRPMADEHGGLLSPDYMGRVIDLEFPAMRPFFRVEQVTDSGLWRRIAALEYLATRLSSRLNS